MHAPSWKPEKESFCFVSGFFSGKHKRCRYSSTVPIIKLYVLLWYLRGFYDRLGYDILSGGVLFLSHVHIFPKFDIKYMVEITRTFKTLNYYNHRLQLSASQFSPSVSRCFFFHVAKLERERLFPVSVCCTIMSDSLPVILSDERPPCGALKSVLVS